MRIYLPCCERASDQLDRASCDFDYCPLSTIIVFLGIVSVARSLQLHASGIKGPDSADVIRCGLRSVSELDHLTPPARLFDGVSQPDNLPKAARVADLLYPI
jgi:hypothetical protein